MEKVIDTFDAVAPNGDVFTIVEIQEYVDVGHSGNPNQQIPGMKRLELTDGTPVNFIRKDTFRVFDSNQELTRVR